MHAEGGGWWRGEGMVSAWALSGGVMYCVDRLCVLNSLWSMREGTGLRVLMAWLRVDGADACTASA